MRVFFSAATENYKEKIAPIETIMRLLYKFGHTQTNPYPNLILSSPRKMKRVAGKAKKMRETIRKSDLFLAEISVPALGVGYNICLAQHYQLPIIFLCLKEYKGNISDFIENLNSRSATVIDYTKNDLEKKLKSALTNAIPKKTRFNMNLDSDVNNTLNILSKESKKTKTEVINNLIRSANRNNSSFII